MKAISSEDFEQAARFAACLVAASPACDPEACAAPTKVSRFRASQDSLPPVDPEAEGNDGEQATACDVRPGTDDATVRTLLASQSLNGSRQERQSFQGIVRCHRSQG